MKKLLIASILLLSTPLMAADTAAYASLWAVSGDKVEYSYAATVGLRTDYNVGVELIMANDDVGGSVFYHASPFKDARILLGVSSIPDTAMVPVPGFGLVQDSTNPDSLFIGIEYNIFSARYYSYRAEHTVTKIGYGTGKTSIQKSAVWAGVTLSF